jgi:PPOX class probable F420-dependent enzyme
VPRGSPPPELQELLRQPNPCVIATIRPDGELHTAATWYEWPGDGTVLVNMDASRRRLGHMRADPRVALTVLDGEQWYRHVSLVGRVREIRHDPELEDIDRIARHYTGKEYRDRQRDSWTAVIDVERWHAWSQGRDLTKQA